MCCCCSDTQWCLTLCNPLDHQASLSFTFSHSLCKLTSIELMMPSNHLILCHSLLRLPSTFSSIRVFSSDLALHSRWPKYWSFSFSISSSSEHSGLTSIMVDWFDLLAVQGTLKSLLQHCSLKALILWRLAFFVAQLSHPYMTTGKTEALTIWNLCSRVMSLLLNMLSMFVIAFLPRSKRLLILMAAVTILSDFGVQENKVSHCFLIYLP